MHQNQGLNWQARDTVHVLFVQLFSYPSLDPVLHAKDGFDYSLSCMMISSL